MLKSLQSKKKNFAEISNNIIIESLTGTLNVRTVRYYLTNLKTKNCSRASNFKSSQTLIYIWWICMGKSTIYFWICNIIVKKLRFPTLGNMRHCRVMLFSLDPFVFLLQKIVNIFVFPIFRLWAYPITFTADRVMCNKLYIYVSCVVN